MARARTAILVNERITHLDQEEGALRERPAAWRSLHEGTAESATICRSRSERVPWIRRSMDELVEKPRDLVQIDARFFPAARADCSTLVSAISIQIDGAPACPKMWRRSQTAPALVQ